RSPIRFPSAAPTEYLTTQQVLALRSALAAVNTLSMQQPYNNPISGAITDPTARSLTLYKEVPNVIPVAPSKPYTATVYGLKQQPFITEIYASNDPYTDGTPDPTDATKLDMTYPHAQNPVGYFAIELYNPYNNPIDLAGT